MSKLIGEYICTMAELVERIENESGYVLDSIFSHENFSKPTNVTIITSDIQFVIPDITDISAVNEPPPYLYFIPSTFVSRNGMILNSNISQMNQVYIPNNKLIKFSLIPKGNIHHHELEIKISQD